MSDGRSIEKTKWLKWAQEIQAIAQAGLEYSRDPYDIERFQRLREISVEVLAEYTEIDPGKISELFAGESGYQTPKVDIRAVVNRGNRILFVRENDGRWSLPGGWADINLSVRENVKKEVREEAGLEVEAERLIAVLDRNRHVDDVFPYSVYKIFVKCSCGGGSFQENIETTDAGFFDKEELPELSETRNTRDQIRMCYRFIQGCEPETLFD